MNLYEPIRPDSGALPHAAEIKHESDVPSHDVGSGWSSSVKRLRGIARNMTPSKNPLSALLEKSRGKATTLWGLQLRDEARASNCRILLRAAEGGLCKPHTPHGFICTSIPYITQVKAIIVEEPH